MTSMYAYLQRRVRGVWTREGLPVTETRPASFETAPARAPSRSGLAGRTPRVRHGTLPCPNPQFNPSASDPNR